MAEDGPSHYCFSVAHFWLAIRPCPPSTRPYKLSLAPAERQIHVRSHCSMVRGDELCCRKTITGKGGHQTRGGVLFGDPGRRDAPTSGTAHCFVLQQLCSVGDTSLMGNDQYIYYAEKRVTSGHLPIWEAGCCYISGISLLGLRPCGQWQRLPFQASFVKGCLSVR